MGGRTANPTAAPPVFNSVPVSAPQDPCTPQQILFGPPVEPEVRIKAYADDEFEVLIREWAFFHRQLQQKRYAQVGRFGGAGDMGRDVVGYIDPPSTSGRLDIFQCKHYGHPLQPGEVWAELGKLCYYTHEGHFAVPEEYRFVAPWDVGPDLAGLLEKPEELRKRLIAAWNEHVSGKIIRKQTVKLEGKLLAHVNAFDFKRVGYKPLHEVIEELRKTTRYAPRFGGGLVRPCPPDPDPPDGIEPHEQRYIEQLIEAYQDHRGPLITLGTLSAHDDLHRHFVRSRERYFCAEMLKQFARDNLPAGVTFEQVQEQVYDTVIDVAERDHANGYVRVTAVTDTASLYQVVNHPLGSYLKSKSLMGICHQLANLNRVYWVRR